MPVIGLATTELATVIRLGANGFVDTRLEALVDAMRALLSNPAMAAEWRAEAARVAARRLAIGRSVADWDAALRAVTS